MVFGKIFTRKNFNKTNSSKKSLLSKNDSGLNVNQIEKINRIEITPTTKLNSEDLQYFDEDTRKMYERWNELQSYYGLEREKIPETNRKQIFLPLDINKQDIKQSSVEENKERTMEISQMLEHGNKLVVDEYASEKFHLFNRALAKYGINDIQGARDIFQELIHGYPSFGRSYTYMAYSYMHHEFEPCNYEEIIKYLKMALHYDDMDVLQNLKSLAEMYTLTGRHDEALKTFDLMDEKKKKQDVANNAFHSINTKLDIQCEHFYRFKCNYSKEQYTQAQENLNALIDDPIPTMKQLEADFDWFKEEFSNSKINS